MPTQAAGILGTGHALPERTLTNADLEKMVETSDDWIVSRTGIRERRIAARTKQPRNSPHWRLNALSRPPDSRLLTLISSFAPRSVPI
ncbi:hypothetical protein [Chloracidobacterium thermophilum]